MGNPGQDNPELAEVEENLIIDMTPEGMRIQIVDQEGGSMFASGSAEMVPRTRQLLDQIAQVVTKLPNKISVSGHTDAEQFGGAGGYSNWELSSDRANASRRGLIDGGLTPDRFVEVTGKAAQEPLVEEDPFAPQNRRISLILLREAPGAAARAANRINADSPGRMTSGREGVAAAPCLIRRRAC